MSSAITPAQVLELFQASENERTASKNHCSSFAPVIQKFQDDNNQKVILSYVNKLLTTSLDRDRGFRYLNLLIFWCSSELLRDHGIAWVAQAVGHNDRVHLTTEAVKLLGNIIPLCKDIQDFNKTLMSTYLLKIIEICISFQINSVQTESALTCLETCLQIYPSTCIPLKKKLESYVLQYLDGRLSDSLIKRAGRCYHFLQQVGGAGPEGINHIKNWSDSLQVLCKTAHILYDKFLEDITDFESYDQPNVVPLNFQPFSSDCSNVDVLSATRNRLRNVSIFMQMMLQTKFPVTKVISPKYVLDVVKRSLSVHMCIMKDHSSVSLVQFGILLMQDQIDSLYLLRSCIVVLHWNLIPLSTMITKLLLDCLYRTTNCTCFNSDSTYKETVYKVLTYWITLLKNNLSTTVHEKLILAIVDDISPIKSEVFLSMTPQSSSHKAKKKAIENKMSTPMKQSCPKEYSKNALQMKGNICYQALDCLICIFKHVHVSVKPNTLRLLYVTVIKTILKLQTGRDVFPYCDVKSEEKLYEALLAIIDRPNNIMSPPLDVAINLFIKGQKSNNYSVTQMCTFGLSIVEKVCQPICPTLNFPITQLEVEREDQPQTNETDLSVMQIDDAVEASALTYNTEISVNITKPDCSTHESEVLKQSEVGIDNISQTDHTNNANEMEQVNNNVMEIEQVNADETKIDDPVQNNYILDNLSLSDSHQNKNKNTTHNENLQSEASNPQKMVKESISNAAILSSEIGFKSSNREDTLLETPQVKRLKYDNDILEKKYEDQDDMMNSFVDVVNDY